MAICKNFNTDTYINAIGGESLYNKEDFSQNEIELKLIKTNSIYYKQFNNDFVPNLSIIDIIMFNGRDKISEMINSHKLI